MSEAVVEQQCAHPDQSARLRISDFADIFSAQAYIRPRLYCRDGLNLDVLAGIHAFSMPRAVNARKYTQVEACRLSQACEPLLQFAQDPAAPCETSYAFVPVGVIETLIAAHGGLDWDVTVENAHANAIPLLNKLKAG